MNRFYKNLIPALISSLLCSCFVLIDGIFIGQKIGDLGLSAINIAWPITAFIQASGSAIGLSCGIHISTLLGENKVIEANKLKGTSIILVSLLAIILGFILYFTAEEILILFKASGTALEYATSYIKVIIIGSIFQMLGMALIPLLKNSNKVFIAMIASISSLITNLILDYVFVYVINAGLVGAAWASVISQVVAVMISIIFYVKEIKGVDFRLKTLKSVFKSALAPFILTYSYSIIIIITNALCISYGGDECVAAYTLLSYLMYIASALATGTADSIQPLFSYNKGCKNYSENYKLLRKCLIISFIIVLCFSILFFIFKNSLGNLYNLSSKAFEFYDDGILYYLLGFLFVAIYKVICSYFYSISKNKNANILILIEPFLLTPIAYLIFCNIFDDLGIWVGYLAIQISLVVLAGIMLQKSITDERYSKV
jgi:putative MATE family efflux protein